MGAITQLKEAEAKRKRDVHLLKEHTKRLTEENRIL
jgi:hypothetical protein